MTRGQVVGRACSWRSSVIALKYSMNFITDSIRTGLGVVGVAHELGVGGPEEALGELHHQRLVGLGHAVDVHDHPQGEGLGDVLGEVALAAQVPQLLDEQVGQGVDPRLAVLDRRRLEPVVGHLPVVAVLLAVEVDQRPGDRDAGLEHARSIGVGSEHRAGGVVPVSLSRDTASTSA